ncbi:hypothetical protein FJR37_14255 [Aphanizomenon sp. UHCC 0183]|nr:hypothetical protein [Aphanizomenon sp. UHCC 0183]
MARQKARGKSEEGLGDFTFLYTVWFYCVHLLTHYQLPITNYQLPITNYQLPVTHYQLPITHYKNANSIPRV